MFSAVDEVQNIITVVYQYFDIGRSHIIGKVKDGKSQVIVRFISYRTRNKVYSNKKGLKNHPDKIFITENLTKYRETKAGTP
jgi:hypothetical protein